MFRTMFSSMSGDISLTRVATFLVVITILSIYIAQNICSMIRDCGYQDFPANSVYCLLIALGAKVGQHVTESLKPSKKIKQTSSEPQK